MTYPVLRPRWRPTVRPRWDPAGDLADLRTEMLRMLGLLTGLRGDGGFTDEVEIEETEDGWSVTAPMPGLGPDQVKVEVEGSELTIRGKVEEETKEDGGGTRRYGYSCRVSIPGEFDPEQIEATMEHGMLTVLVPRSTRGERRQIDVGGQG